MGGITEKERDILLNCSCLIEEQLIDTRKGVPQSKYIIYVAEGTWWDSEIGDVVEIPYYIVGYWMMDSASDNRYTSLSEAIETDSWVKCEKVEVKSYEWREKYDK